MTTAPFRLLLADDDPMLREIMCEGLEEEGFEVVAAQDGAHALELFHSDGPYDALLFDEEMPGLTGRKLLATIRSERSSVPALLVSGSLMLDDAEREALGIGPVLRKPVSIRELAMAIRRAISSSAPTPSRP